MGTKKNGKAVAASNDDATPHEQDTAEQSAAESTQASETLAEKGDTEKVEEVTRMLACELAPTVFRERAMRMAQVEKEIDLCEGELELWNKRLKGKIKGLESERAALADSVRDGTEIRAVNCELWADFTHNTMRTVRLDTGEVIEERPLDADERQRLLVWDGETQAAGDEAGEALAEPAEDDSERERFASDESAPAFPL